MFSKNKKYYTAMTLIELLAVAAIMGIMASVGFVSMKSSQNDAKLKAAQGEVAAAIRTAQSYALQGKTQGGETPCGYGIRFLSNNEDYEIYYNLPPHSMGLDKCSDISSNQVYLRHNTDSNLAESFSLNNGVKLENVTTFGNPNNPTDIYFTVPFGTAYNLGVSIVGYSVSFNYAGKSKSVTVTASGIVKEN